MVKSLNIDNLISLREKVMLKIENRLDSWDKSVDMGLRIVESNTLSFKYLDKLNEDIEKVSVIELYNEEYKELALDIAIKQKRFIQALNYESYKLLDGLKQLRKKHDFLNNYALKKKESIFIDKSM